MPTKLLAFSIPLAFISICVVRHQIEMDSFVVWTANLTHKIKHYRGQWCMPVNSALRSQRRGWISDQLGHTGNPCLREKVINKGKWSFSSIHIVSVYAGCFFWPPRKTTTMTWKCSLLIATLIKISKKLQKGWRGASVVKVYTSLAENPSPILYTHHQVTAAWSSSPKGSDISDLYGHLHWHTHIHT